MDFNIDYLLVGVAKGGTSSIASIVEKSSYLQSPRSKETGFWSEASTRYESCPKLGSFHKNQINDWSSYKKEFSNNSEIKTFEASPDYFYHSESVINKLNLLDQKPDIWIILRNPVLRAYSHYSHFVRDGVFDNDMDFIDVFQQDNTCGASWSLDIRGAGQYFKDLQNYFDSGLSVQVDIFEELFSDDKTLFSRMQDFFGAEIYTGNIPLENKSGRPRSRYIRDLLTSENRLKSLARKFVRPEVRRWAYKGIENINLKKVPISKRSYDTALNFYKEDIENVSNLIGRNLNNIWR